MRSVAVTTDGGGFARLEALALPAPVVGPRATGRESSGTPVGASARTVRPARLGAHEQVSEIPGRILRFVIEGDLQVSAANGAVRLRRGDVVLLEGGDARGLTLSSAQGARLLDVEIDDDWVPSGSVPPPVEAEPGASLVRRMDVEDGEAHFAPFDELWTDDEPQPVGGLSLLCLTEGVASDWHTDESISLVVVLAGGFELEVSGRGGAQVFRAGDVCLVDDREGRGHLTTARGETWFAALTLPEDHRWQRAGGTR